MNWTKILLGGVVMGIVMALVNYVLHGFIMANAYTSRPEVFAQEQANPAYFFLTAIIVALFAAAIFDKSRSAWGALTINGHSG